MQSKQELEEWYSKPDPWLYESTEDDEIRKKKILSHMTQYKRALDIGAGEGFITRDIPAEKIEAIETSDKAAERLPDAIRRVLEPSGYYDLILATGLFYEQYNWRQFHDWILQHSKGTVITSNIKDWEHPLPLKPVHEEEFKYRQYTQHLCIYVPT